MLDTAVNFLNFVKPAISSNDKSVQKKKIALDILNIDDNNDYVLQAIFLDYCNENPENKSVMSVAKLFSLFEKYKGLEGDPRLVWAKHFNVDVKFLNQPYCKLSYEQSMLSYLGTLNNLDLEQLNREYVEYEGDGLILRGLEMGIALADCQNPKFTKESFETAIKLFNIYLYTRIHFPDYYNGPISNAKNTFFIKGTSDLLWIPSGFFRNYCEKENLLDKTKKIVNSREVQIKKNKKHKCTYDIIKGLSFEKKIKCINYINVNSLSNSLKIKINPDGTLLIKKAGLRTRFNRSLRR